MKKIAITLTLVMMVSIGFGHFASDITQQLIRNISFLISQKTEDVAARKKIQVALILDTSNSMDGLIDQAKTELWNIVNELAKARKDSTEASISIALYEYGNSNLSRQSGYIRKVVPFTNDLDELSDQLFKLKTNGGDEFCGKVIKEAIDNLDWEDSKEALKIVYIAGNEPFSQGPVSYEKSCRLAVKKGIYINTIHCGDRQVGINGKWALGATYGTGNYFAIDQDEKTYLVSTPYDDEINALNEQLNATYIPYGTMGTSYYRKQKVQDKNAYSYSKNNNTARSISKASHIYENSAWDLVDAYEKDTEVIVRVKRSTLDKALQHKNTVQLEAYVMAMRAKREEIKRKINELAAKRQAYIIAQKKEMANSLGNSIIQALHEQAGRKNFTFVTI